MLCTGCFILNGIVNSYFWSHVPAEMRKMQSSKYKQFCNSTPQACHKGDISLLEWKGGWFGNLKGQWHLIQQIFIQFYGEEFIQNVQIFIWDDLLFQLLKVIALIW